MVMVRMDRRLLSRFDPSDVVQEALTQAAASLSDYLQSPPAPFYLWLRRLTWEHLVRLRKYHLKAQRRSILRESTANADASTVRLVERLARSDWAPEGRLVHAEMKSRLLRGLKRLSEEDREILVLRFLEHHTPREIAEVTGLSEGAVRTRQTRALARLARLIDRDEGE
jgi:RNA polymerase sigma-70 factor (ECF subfamily)